MSWEHKKRMELIGQAQREGHDSPLSRALDLAVAELRQALDLDDEPDEEGPPWSAPGAWGGRRR